MPSRIVQLLTTLVAALVMLAGTSARADNDKPLTLADKQFLAAAGENAHAALAFSKVAMKRSSSKDITRVARLMMSDGNTTIANLKKLAKDHSWKAPTRPSASQRRLVRYLNSVSRSQFNREFTRYALRTSNTIAPRFRTAVANADDSHVREFAAKYLPAVQNQAIMIQNIAGEYKLPTSEARTPAGRG